MDDAPKYACNSYLAKKNWKAPEGLVAYAYSDYSDFDPDRGGAVTSFEFVVVGDTFATAHSGDSTYGGGERDETAVDALERLDARVSELEQELAAARRVRDLAVAATTYEDLSEVSEGDES